MEVDLFFDVLQQKDNPLFSSLSKYGFRINYRHVNELDFAAIDSKLQTVLLAIFDKRTSVASVISKVKSLNPRSKIVVIREFNSVETVVRAMRSGASDYLAPNSSPAHIARRIRLAQTTSTRFNPTLAEPDAFERIAVLSPRERQVIDGLLDGRTNRMIAETMGISARTVETHRARIMQKCNASTFPELVKICVQAGVYS